MIICGTFTTMLLQRPQAPIPAGESRTVPADRVQQAGSPYAYLRLNGIREQTTLELNYVDLSDQKVLFSGTIDLKPVGPLESLELNVPLPPLPHPHAGSYSLDVLWKDELLGQWRVEAMFRPDSEAETST